MGEFSEPGCRHGWRQANVPEAGNARDRARVCACQSVPVPGCDRVGVLWARCVWGSVL